MVRRVFRACGGQEEPVEKQRGHRLPQGAGLPRHSGEPQGAEVLGERAYATVSEIPEKVDVVDVFVRAEKTPEVARDATEAGRRFCGCNWA